MLGISGSTRVQSTNSGLVRAARDFAKGIEEVEFEIANIDLPLFSEDLEAKGYPEPVRIFRAQVAAADALVIAVPEHNYSVSAALKNAIDWASRTDPADKSMPLKNKEVAIMGSGGGMGTGRAQYHFRQIAVFLDLRVLNKPEVFVRRWGEKPIFDNDGNVTDEKTKSDISALVQALVAQVGCVKRGRA